VRNERIFRQGGRGKDSPVNENFKSLNYVFAWRHSSFSLISYVYDPFSRWKGMKS
jgi:hypothetical protein